MRIIAKNKTSTLIVQSLLLISFGISVYLTEHFYTFRYQSTHFHSACAIQKNFDCDQVAISSYAEIFPHIPLASLGSGYFFALFCLALFLSSSHKTMTSVLTLLTGLGVLIQGFYFLVMIFQIQTFCLLCLIIDILLLLIFLTLLWAPLDREKFTFAFFRSMTLRKSLAWTLGCLISFTFGLKFLFDTPHPSQTDVQNQVTKILSTPPISLDHLITETTPTLTSHSQAPITIVEFSDFQCPYCRVGAMILNQLTMQYPTQLRIFFKNFPLQQHPFALTAAQVATCSYLQMRFQPFYEFLFENQNQLNTIFDLNSSNRLFLLAQQNNISFDQLRGCMTSSEIQSKIKQDMDEAIALTIDSIPTFFINGYRVTGIFPIEVWKKLIEQLLKTVTYAMDR